MAGPTLNSGQHPDQTARRGESAWVFWSADRSRVVSGQSLIGTCSNRVQLCDAPGHPEVGTGPVGGIEGSGKFVGNPVSSGCRSCRYKDQATGRLCRESPESLACFRSPRPRWLELENRGRRRRPGADLIRCQLRRSHLRAYKCGLCPGRTCQD